LYTAQSFVLIKQLDSPGKSSSSTQEPTNIPKILIYFADFPCPP